ncbi:MAG: outer membrane protein assembly factor BamD [Sandaracinaceae bacterium]|jgi:hypothetical protein|nr:outer membrane protein assembly factor BamD [Sandaracinaceae bacterium]
MKRHEHMGDHPKMDRALLNQARSEMSPTSAQRASLKRGVLAAVAGGAMVGGAATAKAAVSAASTSKAALSAAATKSASTAGLGFSASASSLTGGVIAKWSVAVVLVGASALGVGALVQQKRAERSSPVHVAQSSRAVEVPREMGLRRYDPPSIPIAGAPIVNLEIPQEQHPPAPVRAASREREDAPSRTADAPVAPLVAGAPATTEPVTDSLAAETALLRDAHTAINRGDAAAAISLLEAHAQRFPGGVLMEERVAFHALAMCHTSAQEEARAEVERFAAQYPHSPQLARLRRACSPH